jgi:hypothetical protein
LHPNEKQDERKSQTSLPNGTAALDYISQRDH